MALNETDAEVECAWNGGTGSTQKGAVSWAASRSFHSLTPAKQSQASLLVELDEQGAKDGRVEVLPEGRTRNVVVRAEGTALLSRAGEEHGGAP